LAREKEGTHQDEQLFISALIFINKEIFFQLTMKNTDVMFPSKRQLQGLEEWFKQ
jgi:hypothetical protein